MNKKGISTIIIPIAVIVFTASVILIWLMFFAIPGIGNISTTEYKIGSDTKNGDEYINTISQLNFLKTKAKSDETVTGVMQKLFLEKEKTGDEEYNRLSKELDELSEEYSATFDKRCISLQLENDKKEILWIMTKDICKTYGVGAFADASITYVPIPTEEPGKDMRFVQRVSLAR